MSEPSTQGPPSPSEASLPAAASAKSNLRESATLKDQSIDKAAAQSVRSFSLACEEEPKK
eukprot:jgi/Mesen1/1764/ME000014S01172